MSTLKICQAAPLVSVQDSGRFAMLEHGIAASGPMDREAFEAAGACLEVITRTGLEIAAGRTVFKLQGGPVLMAFRGLGFEVRVNHKKRKFRTARSLKDQDVVEIIPSTKCPSTNYAYIRFDHELDVPQVMHSYATNMIAGLGGYHGRSLKKGDLLGLRPLKTHIPVSVENQTIAPSEPNQPIRVIWGLHADQFTSAMRQKFTCETFFISRKMDRMGVHIEDSAGVFADQNFLSLVSDAIVPGDIQILGDGHPIVLMRDHQPTGGYPRIATIISADLSRFSRLRPGQKVTFTPVSVVHAHQILAGKHL